MKTRSEASLFLLFLTAFRQRRANVAVIIYRLLIVPRAGLQTKLGLHRPPKHCKCERIPGNPHPNKARYTKASRSLWISQGREQQQQQTSSSQLCQHGNSECSSHARRNRYSASNNSHAAKIIS